MKTAGARSWANNKLGMAIIVITTAKVYAMFRESIIYLSIVDKLINLEWIVPYFAKKV